MHNVLCRLLSQTGHVIAFFIVQSRKSHRLCKIVEDASGFESYVDLLCLLRARARLQRLGLAQAVPSSPDVGPFRSRSRKRDSGHERMGGRKITRPN